MLLRVLVLTCGLTVATVVPTRADENNAIDVLPGCKQIIQITEGKFKYRDVYGKMTLPEAVEKAENSGTKMGECLGMILGARYVRDILPVERPNCREVPKGVTTEQLMRTVINYLDKNPDRLDQYFLHVAIDAILQAWPCQAKSTR
jgi:hypothetical protein